MEKRSAWQRIGRAALAAAVLVLAVGLALGAVRRVERQTEVAMPSFALPNIIAAGMCAAVLVVASKRFRRT